MGSVVDMHRDPVDFVTNEAKGRELVACALIGVDSEGRYVSTSAGMSPEEMLMASEMLRERALQDAMEEH